MIKNEVWMSLIFWTNIPAEQSSSASMGGRTIYVNSTRSWGDEIKCSEPIHTSGLIEETLLPEKCLGPVDSAIVQRVEERWEGVEIIRIVRNLSYFKHRRLRDILNLQTHFNLRDPSNGKFPFEHGYISSPPQMMNYVPFILPPSVLIPAKYENIKTFRQILFRSSILSTSSNEISIILLHLPSISLIFLILIALAKFDHLEDEVNLARGAGLAGISNSCPSTHPILSRNSLLQEWKTNRDCDSNYTSTKIVLQRNNYRTTSSTRGLSWTYLWLLMRLFWGKRDGWIVQGFDYAYVESDFGPGADYCWKWSQIGEKDFCEVCCKEFCLEGNCVDDARYSNIIAYEKKGAFRIVLYCPRCRYVVSSLCR